MQRALSVVICAVLLASSAGCSPPNQGPALVLETSDGYTFVRNRGTWSNDNVLYPGQMIAGPDTCLYVEVDQFPGKRFLAVLGSETYFQGGGLSTRGSGRVFIGKPAKFGRDGDQAWESMKAQFLQRCNEADDLWGIG